MLDRNTDHISIHAKNDAICKIGIMISNKIRVRLVKLQILTPLFAFLLHAEKVGFLGERCKRNFSDTRLKIVVLAGPAVEARIANLSVREHQHRIRRVSNDVEHRLPWSWIRKQ